MRRLVTCGFAGLVLVGAVTLGSSCSAAGDPADGTGASGSTGGNGGGGGDNPFGCASCVDGAFVVCDESGNPVEQKDCGEQVCVPDLGCADCTPDMPVCVGNDIHACNQAGEIAETLDTCEPGYGEFCVDGVCGTECDLADTTASNIGCEFWSVDLPNERGANSAASDPYGVVLSNAGTSTAEIIVEQNDAGPGEPLSLTQIGTIILPVNEVAQIELPRREVTGWTPQTADPPGPPMTHLSSNAYRITSSVPLVVYQFNVFENSYSNDASLLIPRNGLGKIYRVLGYPTANPISFDMFPLAGIPDRSSVTIVGVANDTHVTVQAGTKIIGGGNIPTTEAGGLITATLGPFDVLNLSSDGIPGDMTGTVVQADQPVAVFTSNERAIGPAITDPPPPPDYVPEDLCCTDHLEEQLFPVTAMGKDFVISRSPIRSSGGYAEPDELRILGVAAAATVTTNLPPPYDNFTVQPGEVVNTWTDKDVVMRATEPIAIGQILVSAGFTTAYTGDPALTIFPPVEQYRSMYNFHVPPSWSNNQIVVAAPVGGTFELDGAALGSGCTQSSAGAIDAQDYETLRCPVGEGAHRLTGTVEFGLTVYGYGNVGSYAFAGGADVEAIYEPPPIIK